METYRRVAKKDLKKRGNAIMLLPTEFTAKERAEIRTKEQAILFAKEDNSEKVTENEISNNISEIKT